MTNFLAMDKFCSCLELWKGCVLAGIFAMSTSIFDLLWSTAHMIDEENVIFFYLLFTLGIESVWFIAITGLLFLALIRKSKCLLIPWLFMALLDIVFSLLVSFAELALPNNLSTVSCSLPVASTLVTILVCIVMVYCWLCVYAQYLSYSLNSGNAQIKVMPEQNDGYNHSDYNADNTLKIPKMSPPKEAW